MSWRWRIQWFGGAGVLVLAGIAAAIVVNDGLGEILALVLISLGLVAATALVFYEVGLSEDRDRAREEAERAARRRAPRLHRPQLDRMRGRRRGPS